MVHKKYTYKNGRKFGPYYYETKRVDGKIVTTYLGRDFKPLPPEQNSIKLIPLIFLILGFGAVLLLILFNPFSTGKAVLEIDDNYIEGEVITGSLKLNLAEGELLPGDSQVIINFGGESKAFLLSELIGNEKIEGNFYADNAALDGVGLCF